MVDGSELMLFVVRAASGQFRLLTEEGTVVVEAESWRELRCSLDRLLQSDTNLPARVAICVGRPRQPPKSMPAHAPLAVAARPAS
jgi:hypothetical protein